MKHLRVLVLVLLCLSSGARRSVRINDSHQYAQQQNSMLANGLEVSAVARDALIPGSVGTGVFRHAGPQARAVPEGYKYAGRRAEHHEPHRAARRAKDSLMADSDPKKANPVLGVASSGMGLIKPVFRVESAAQAAVTNLGGYDAAEIRAEIEQIASRAPVVIMTYGLSPFSSEAVAVIESTGAKFENYELGGEWFLLGPKGSAIRNELGELYGQTSLPHIWIGGQHVGGLYSGGPAGAGLQGLVASGELGPMLKKARAL